MCEWFKWFLNLINNYLLKCRVENNTMNLGAGTKVADTTSPVTLRSTTKNCCRILATIRWPILLKQRSKHRSTGLRTKLKSPTVIPRRFGCSSACSTQLVFTQLDSRGWSEETSSWLASGASTTSTGLVTSAGVLFTLGQVASLRAHFYSAAQIWRFAEHSTGTTTISRWKRSTLNKRLVWSYQSSTERDSSI